MISGDAYEIDRYDTFDTMMWLSPSMPHGHRSPLSRAGPPRAFAHAVQALVAPGVARGHFGADHGAATGEETRGTFANRFGATCGSSDPFC